MPTKRRQNTPGKNPQPSRNSHRSRAGAHGARSGVRGAQGSIFSGGGKRPSTQQGFSTSGPKMGFTQKPSAKVKGTTNGYQPNPLNVAPQGGSKITPEVLLTRRNLLIGAAAIGGIAAVGGGISLASSALDTGSTEEISSISVPTEAVEEQSSYTLLTYTDYVQTTGSFHLPFGTLVWADNDTVACCLNPTETASPLCTIGLLYLSSGNTATVIDAAQGASEGYEILDARCSENGLIWIESNTYESRWRVYTASLSSGAAANIQQVDEGDSNWLMPSLAAINNSAFWQVVPNSSGDAANNPAVLKAANFGSAESREVYSSKRAFATRVTAATDGVVITPRAESTSVYYQLTKISADTFETVDQMTLPSSMTPDIAGYGRSGFSFGFSSIYNYGGGIANLGTYTPRSEVQARNYNNLQWFRYSRSPITTPCWCGDWFVVKSTTALSGVHFSSKSYFAIDVVSGADTFGEQLVSSGTCSSFVGLTNVIDDTNTDNNYTLIRVFTPIDGAVGDAFSA